MLEDENSWDTQKSHPAGHARAHWECCSYAMVRSTPESAAKAAAAIDRMSTATWYQNAARCQHWRKPPEC